MTAIIETGVSAEPRLLIDIPRSFSDLEEELCLNSDALIVNDDLVLAYKTTHDKVIGKLFITRELTKVVKVERTGREVIVPHFDQDSRENKFGTIILNVGEDFSVFYVGEQYAITTEFLGEILAVEIDSTKPITTEPLDGRANFAQALASRRMPQGNS